MAGKPRPLIIEAEDFRVFLMARMGALGLTVAGLAEELGVSTQAAYSLLSGELLPSDEIARKVGLRPAYVMDAGRDASDEEDAHPKGKTKK